MRAVIQRVNRAEVRTSRKTASIKHGLMILLGIEESDTPTEADWMVQKIMKLRIFNDEEGKMNRSVQDVNGELMVISQFTLYGDARKGTRPSYIKAARPETAIPLYEYVVEKLQELSEFAVATGEFGAHMEVELVNDGPVTLILERENQS